MRLGQRSGSAAGDPRLPPKIERLHVAAARGLPVPEGLVLLPPPDGGAPRLSPDQEAMVAPWLAAGGVIVRSARAEEDGEQSAHAGLGLSIPGCRDLAALRHALATVAAPDSEGRSPAAVLLQRQVDVAHLVVAALPAPGDGAAPPAYVEVHGGGPEVLAALAAGASPDLAGPLAAWAHPAADRIEALLETLSERWAEPAVHGLDLELVVDRGDVPWLVQLRPLTRSPWPGWPEFQAALDEDHAAGRLPDLTGLLVLDAEHNPAPLSPAHAALVRRLSGPESGVGAPVVVADWLYVRTKSRALGSPRVGDASNPPLDPVAALRRLHGHHLPRARRALRRSRAALAECSLDQLAVHIDRAWALFDEMIAVYAGEIIPARATGRDLGDTEPDAAADTEGATTLRDRARFLDVLPAAWDLASPPLADLLGEGDDLGARADTGQVLPTSRGAAARLLAEWDDHLFGLGLAPMRAVYLRAAQLLGISEALTFGLEPAELAELATLAAPGPTRGEAIAEATATAALRLDRTRRRAQLRPPPRLWYGRALPGAPGVPLSGVAIGEDHIGRVTVRPSLEALLRAPPEAGRVVCLPALTAPAAVALHALGVVAVCTEHGGALSHAAIMARELGLSALIGCRGCTELPEGQRVHLDTKTARLRPLP